jgi:hypothetical protein
MLSDRHEKTVKIQLKKGVVQGRKVLQFSSGKRKMMFGNEPS